MFWYNYRYRLHSTYFIVNYLLVFGLDSRYVNLQRSSQHWYCPINKANKTIVEIWKSKCWIKVNAYDFSACGWVLVPGSMIRPVVCTSQTFIRCIQPFIRYIQSQNTWKSNNFKIFRCENIKESKKDSRLSSYIFEGGTP
jgi:hypothetical protein